MKLYWNLFSGQLVSTTSEHMYRAAWPLTRPPVHSTQARPGDARATRRPRLSRRAPGTTMTWAAARASAWLTPQDPPRATRRAGPDRLWCRSWCVVPYGCDNRGKVEETMIYKYVISILSYALCSSSVAMVAFGSIRTRQGACSPTPE